MQHLRKYIVFSVASKSQSNIAITHKVLVEYGTYFFHKFGK